MALEYIAVRFNTAAVNEVCVACKTVITEKHYVRDLSTRIVYHNQWCMHAHVVSSNRAIEDKSHVAV
jgi:hypothetical protein